MQILRLAGTPPSGLGHWEALGRQLNYGSHEILPSLNALWASEWGQKTDFEATAFPFRPSSFCFSVDMALGEPAARLLGLGAG